jgi:PAS domain S-box-containing protein
LLALYTQREKPVILDPAALDLLDSAHVESAALDLLPSGIGVFDKDFNLVYANRSFRELRFLPKRLCVPGTRLEDIVRHIAARGDYGAGEVDVLVKDRMAEILTLEPWEDEQDIEGRRRLAIRHVPVPGGGLMITYADVTEARATECKLRENEERYSRVSEAVAEGIYDWNVVDNTLYVSDRVMEIFGFEGQLTSYDWNSRVHPDDAGAYRDALRECFRNITVKVACQYRIKARDGNFRWVEDHGLPIRNGAGRATRLVGCVSDITKRRSTEEALRNSEQRYATAMEAINEAVYEWDIATGEMYYSPRLYDLIALTPQELSTRQQWLDRIHPDDMPHYRAALAAHLKGETERLEVEYRYRHADGSWHWARQHGVASRDRTGRAYRLSGSTGDITTEKRLGEELDRARRQLEDALESIAEGFVLFDPQDRIVMCNSHYRALFTDVAHMVRPGNTFESFMRAAVERGIFPAAAKDPEGFMAAVLARRRNPGGPREQYLSSGISLQISDYKMSDGTHVGVYTDITEQKQRQAEIAKAKGEAESALEQLKVAQQQLIVQGKLASLGQLTAGIAHEIKNPLNFVNNFAALSGELLDELDEMLKPLQLDGKTREGIVVLTDTLKGNLEKVVQHGKRADSIVKNMLLHSREGSGERRLTDINAILDESLNLAYHGARAEKPNFNIALRRDFDASAGAVDLYPQEMTRALLNLISNGVYAATRRKIETGDTGDQPELNAATKNLGDKVEIRIRDNGAGIPNDIREKMFNPFFTTKPAGEGTGLGLSMSHDIIVKQHCGTIEVETEPGAFTEFIITLPRTGGAQIQGGEPAP